MGRARIEDDALYQRTREALEPLTNRVRQARADAEAAVRVAKEKVRADRNAIIAQAYQEGLSKYAIGKLTGCTSKPSQDKLFEEVFGTDWGKVNLHEGWVWLLDGFRVEFPIPAKDNDPEDKKWAIITITTPNFGSFTVRKEYMGDGIRDMDKAQEVNRGAVDEFCEHEHVYFTVWNWRGGDPVETYEQVLVDYAP